MVVGLGNPGLRYAHTRHNVGFDAVDSLAKLLKVRISKTSCGAKICRVNLGDILLVLAKPLSFMNLSGQPVKCLANANEIPFERWIFIHDDIDLPVGALRIRLGGSSGGQKGIKSIQELTGKTEFYRIKIGIGRPETKEDIVDHVLDRPSTEERDDLKKAIQDAAKAALIIINEGLEAAGNKFNRSKKGENGQDNS